MANIKNTNKTASKKPSLNLAFALALVSVICCWFYGLPALVAGIFALKNIIALRRNKKTENKAITFKMKWGYFLAWSGITFSLVFTVVYLIAFITGAFIRI